MGKIKSQRENLLSDNPLRGNLLADPMAFLEVLISMPTVTPVRPDDDPVFPLLKELLEPLGFTTQCLPFEEEGTESVQNLHATIQGIEEGKEAPSPSMAYMGHLDVVPPGDVKAWSSSPWSLERLDGYLIGRGMVDMKGSVVAFLCGLYQCFDAYGPIKRGRLDLLLTGDEEGVAINGTEKMLKHLGKDGLCETFLIGEPSSLDRTGDQVRTGRRGSLNVIVHLRGKQGHVAYPSSVRNPFDAMGDVLSMCGTLDKGEEGFPPSYLSCTYVDVSHGPIFNVTPEHVSLFFNVRYNSLWEEKTLIEHIKKMLEKKVGTKPIDVTLERVGNAPFFVSSKGSFLETVKNAIEKETSLSPRISNVGGTSDMRFLPSHVQAVELGLVGRSIHQINERVKEEDFFALIVIYRSIIESMFYGSVSSG